MLKCIGGTGRQFISGYLLQVIAMGLAGSVLGIILANLALLFVAQHYAASLPANMSYGLQPGAMAQGLALGLLISLLFSALPLLRIRHIKPNLLLRADESAARRSFDWLRWTTAGLVIIGLILTSSWQAGSLRIGIFFFAGLALTTGALYEAASLLIRLVRRSRHHIRLFALRQAISSLHRPGNQTRVIVMTVGLGAFLVISVQSLESNLKQELDLSRRTNLPDMFLIDIQTDQKNGVEGLVEQATGVRPVLVPTARARIVAINDRNIDLEEVKLRRERGLLGREYVVTYRPTLEANETIIAGKFWEPTPATEAEVSIEEGMRGLLGLDVGSTITFDVLGRRLNARVTSIRRVDWRNSRTGFLVLFRPGTLENAPQTLIAAINGPPEATARTHFQRDILEQFPNVSVIDVADIVRTLTRILDNVALAVSFIGGFVLLSGVLILVGSIAMTKFQRIYEAAVLKTLGAKRKVLLMIIFAEYGLLGLIAGLIGSLAAIGLSYAIARFVFEIPWTLTPTINLVGIVAAVVLVVVVGAISSFDVLARKPLTILRAQ